MSKPTLIWVSLLAGSQESEVSPLLLQHFDVRNYNYLNINSVKLQDLNPCGAIFDFDYPDQYRLSIFKSFKSRHQSIPAIITTLQHSESLAVWAFRHGALDYLVKPIAAQEWREGIDRILRTWKLRNSQIQRNAELSQAAMPETVPRGSRSTREKLAPAIFYVQQNYSRRIYSDAVARMCGLSPTGFSRAFKETFQRTFQEFLLRFRVAKSCDLLDNPGANIADVAYTVGFSDPSYFARVFKRIVGATPTDYLARRDDSQFQCDVADEFADVNRSSSGIFRSLAYPERKRQA